MTRQGVVLILARAAALAGLDRSAALVAPGVLGRVLTELDLPGPAQARDAALLLLGWVGALRRSGLAGLDWDDLTAEDDGDVRVLIRRQKNDADGAGHTFWASPGKDPLTCPVTAVALWREHLAGLLGRDPADLPGTPVFVRLDRAGKPERCPSGLPRRLSPGAVHDTIVRATTAAGHPPGRYGSHSLRSGMITEAAGTDGVNVLDIVGVSGHKHVESVMRYVRPVHARRRHPARRMAL